MNLYIARHGETDWNKEPARCQGWTDVPLNKKGLEQAEEIARAAKKKQIKKIYSSHLKRARETAQVVAALLDIDVQVDKRFAEARKGLWEGIPFLKIEQEYPEIWKQWLESPYLAPIPDGETLCDVVLRAGPAISEIAARNTEDTLIISHGGPISALRCINEGVEFDRIHEMHPGNGQLFNLAIEPFIILNDKVVKSPFDDHPLNAIRWS